MKDLDKLLNKEKKKKIFEKNNKRVSMHASKISLEDVITSFNKIQKKLKIKNKD